MANKIFYLVNPLGVPITRHIWFLGNMMICRCCYMSFLNIFYLSQIYNSVTNTVPQCIKLLKNWAFTNLKLLLLRSTYMQGTLLWEGGKGGMKKGLGQESDLSSLDIGISMFWLKRCHYFKLYAKLILVLLEIRIEKKILLLFFLLIRVNLEREKTQKFVRPFK